MWIRRCGSECAQTRRVRPGGGGSGRYRRRVTLHDALQPFLGTWTGRENVAVSGQVRAAEADATFVLTDIPGIGVSVDYARRRADTGFAGRGIIAGDGWWWFDTSGAVPTEPGTARVVDGVLVLDRRDGDTRTVIRLSIQDGNLVQMLDAATPASGPLQPSVRGAYTPA